MCIRDSSSSLPLQIIIINLIGIFMKGQFILSGDTRVLHPPTEKSIYISPNPGITLPPCLFSKVQHFCKSVPVCPFISGKYLKLPIPLFSRHRAANTAHPVKSHFIKRVHGDFFRPDIFPDVLITPVNNRIA